MARISVKSCAQATGEQVEIAGWVDVRRDHGKLIFLDIRDESGKIQAVSNPSNKEAHAHANTVRPEWVISVHGLIKDRPEGMKNDKIATGSVEMEIKKLVVLNEAETPPFEIASDGYDINEEVRLENRYIDLRRARMQKNIKLRSKVIQELRKYLINKEFDEIETPYLTKSTPEGSRDFLVPSRMQPGKFYALPQSPQQYKQLLMASGFEKYFQIVRAMRDEDLRADRSFEHTQLDMEMAFSSRDEILGVIEGMMIHMTEALGFQIKEKPFPRFTYDEVIKKYKADKFDLRSDAEKKDNIQAFAWVSKFPFFEEKDGSITFTHNPFSNPIPEDEDELLNGDPLKVHADQYDLVLNGYEVAGGSIRAHKAKVLERVLTILGHSKDKIDSEFGHMLKALKSGTPPHGGVALGVDRIVMSLASELSLREVQAFPMTSGGRTSVMDAPSEVDEKQLKELGLFFKKDKEDES
jgi:aspartyl-tRNA synthetase